VFSRPGWLDVMVSVEQHCGRADGSACVPVDGRVGAFDLQQPYLPQAGSLQHPGCGLCRPPHLALVKRGALTDGILASSIKSFLMRGNSAAMADWAACGLNSRTRVILS